MNDLDELIRRELDGEALGLDDLLHPREGAVGMLVDAFQGSMGRWVWLVAVVNLVAGGLMFWCGYQFLEAPDIDARMFWGIWLVVTVIMGTALKYWSWMEMNRTSIKREISRLELALLALKNTVAKSSGEIQ